MQTTAIGTVANSLPQNEVILLTLLISKRYILYTDLLNKFASEEYRIYVGRQIIFMSSDARIYILATGDIKPTPVACRLSPTEKVFALLLQTLRRMQISGNYEFQLKIL